MAREAARHQESALAAMMLSVAVHLLRGRPDLVRSQFALGPRNGPQAPWCLFHLMAGLAEGDHAHVQRAVAFARELPPEPLIAMGQFLGEAAKGQRVAAMAHLTPEVEAVLWNDFQYTECVAEGFAVLGDVANLVRWLGRSVDLGLAYIAPLVESHAVWRQWLAHPEVAPLLARCRQHAARYAAIPLAPRAASLVARGE